MNAASMKKPAITARMPMQTRYPRSATIASRHRPVAAHVAKGMIDTIPAMTAMNRSA